MHNEKIFKTSVLISFYTQNFSNKNIFIIRRSATLQISRVWPEFDLSNERLLSAVLTWERGPTPKAWFLYMDGPLRLWYFLQLDNNKAPSTAHCTAQQVLSFGPRKQQIFLSGPIWGRMVPRERIRQFKFVSDYKWLLVKSIMWLDLIKRQIKHSMIH